MKETYVPSALCLQPGETEDERRLVWYQPKKCRQAFVELTTLADFERENGFGKASRRIEGTVNAIPLNGTDVSCKVRIVDLMPGEKYVYRVGSETGVEDAVHSFRVPENDTKRCFAVAADMHIRQMRKQPGENGQITYADKWQRVTDRLATLKPDLLVSVGDNICQYAFCGESLEQRRIDGEKEMAAFLAPEMMKSVPFLSCLGNHDAMLGEISDYSSLTGAHFDLPHDDGFSGHALNGSTGDAYYQLGPVLLIAVNASVFSGTNAENMTMAVHERFIEKAIAACSTARWRVLINHEAPYGCAGVANEDAFERARKITDMLASLCDSWGIDVCFSGHNHAFSCSHPLKNGVVTQRGNQLIKPEGTVYYNVPAVMEHSFTGLWAPVKTLQRIWGFTEYHGREEDGGIRFASPMFVFAEADDHTMSIYLMRSDKEEPVDRLILSK